MTSKEYLDYCVDNYYKRIIDKYGFALVDTYTEGMGALYLFENNSFRLRFVNDRGFVNTEIGSLYDRTNFRDVDMLYAYILLTQQENLTLNAVDKKAIITKSLSCEEAVVVIDKDYNEIARLLNKDNYKMTIESLANLAREHDHYLFGRPL